VRRCGQTGHGVPANRQRDSRASATKAAGNPMPAIPMLRARAPVATEPNRARYHSAPNMGERGDGLKKMSPQYCRRVGGLGWWTQSTPRGEKQIICPAIPSEPNGQPRCGVASLAKSVRGGQRNSCMTDSANNTTDPAPLPRLPIRDNNSARWLGRFQRCDRIRPWQAKITRGHQNPAGRTRGHEQ